MLLLCANNALMERGLSAEAVGATEQTVVAAHQAQRDKGGDERQHRHDDAACDGDSCTLTGV